MWFSEGKERKGWGEGVYRGGRRRESRREGVIVWREG